MRVAPRAIAATALFIMPLIAVTACSSTSDYYRRDPYVNDRTIDTGLAFSEEVFVTALRTGDGTSIRENFTAPPTPFENSMALFVSRYRLHPVHTIKRTPGDDATAEQQLSITCAPGHVQTVQIAWAWFDDAWRAWPADQDRPYPGC